MKGGGVRNCWGFVESLGCLSFAFLRKVQGPSGLRVLIEVAETGILLLVVKEGL